MYIYFVMSSMKKYLLTEIAEISLGFTLRNGVKLLDKGRVAFLHQKDIQDDTLVFNQYVNLEQSSLEKHLLKKDDLLLTNKGTKFATYIFTAEDEKSSCCIASSSFFVIKTNITTCLPEYLQWYLQQPDAKEYLLSRSITTTIPSLSKAVLTKLQVLLPPLTLQEKIIDIVTGIRNEEILLKRLINKRQEQKEAYIREILSEQAESDC